MEKYKLKEDIVSSVLPVGKLCFINIEMLCRTDEGYIFIPLRSAKDNIDCITDDFSKKSYSKSLMYSDHNENEHYIEQVFVPIIDLGHAIVLVSECISQYHQDKLDSLLVKTTSTDYVNIALLEFLSLNNVPIWYITDETRPAYMSLLLETENFEKLGHIKNTLDSFIKENT